MFFYRRGFSSFDLHQCPEVTPVVSYSGEPLFILLERRHGECMERKLS